MSKQTKRFFGTDGIRDRVGRGMIRPDKVLKLGWAVGHVLREQGGRQVLIGKDTRISGYMFESALEAGLIAAGVDVLLTGPMPTPAIAYLTRTFSADMGIVISASHNPHHDNGIKFFDADGQKVADEVEEAIEAAFHHDLKMVPSEALGKASRIDDAPGRYIEFCKSTYDAPVGLKGLRIVLDCANGATYHIAPSVFSELGAEVDAINVSPDGLNINAGCGATDLIMLRQRVREAQADLGIAFDGDGDRVMFVDSEGEVFDGDDVLYLLATGQSERPQGVVGTVMTNMAIEQALAEQGIKLVRTPVGDRHVMAALKERRWCFGAEPSGHVLCMHRLTTGDGIIAALQVLAVLQRTGTRLQDWRVNKFPNVLRNVRCDDPSILETTAWKERLAEAQALLGEQGRILVRPSGTEPLIRVMVEAQDAAQAEALAQALAEWLETKNS
ncbi:phosphoglucosamine mutase [Sulfurivirga caldicuralii]|uniref:Phosphoglucosamine mutase n=1 Tax=Sulfurivirga caldicuralii TaxID=364032 RepID=A0A1N6ET43_9GAMM|nr:phosphoglucosamine mutase [Sulfurivirga caldicuralii]SIN86170.1 phosphoglucosamine mutase [Sulfurivirga caldicuralii]